MKQTILILLLAISGLKSFAQTDFKEPIQAIEKTQSDLPEIDSTWFETKEIIVNDTLRYTIRDVVEAKRIDSLWLSFLLYPNRYEEMYEAVSEQTFEEIDYEELPTELLKERLLELNSKTPFKIEYSPQLESVIKQYLKSRRKILTRIIGLSKFYFPMFEEVLDKHNLPLELKYLAVVESGLDPRAKSRVGASGLWQFMYATGKSFGLENNSYVDDRHEPILATEAASQYLRYLHDTFDDWDLALAAYNSGPGNVSKAIRRSGGSTNYWNIRPFLPRETANYLPAFLATMYIFEYADEHGFYNESTILPIATTDTVHVKEMISFKHISEITDISEKDLQYLNPSYKLGIIPFVKERTHFLRLPLEALGTFVANEEKIYAYAKEDFDKGEKPNPQLLLSEPERIRYKVKNGDYLGKIANKYRVSVSQIRQWNGLKNNNIRAGQTLVIYPRI